jgi:hypothetical protein
MSEKAFNQSTVYLSNNFLIKPLPLDILSKCK